MNSKILEQARAWIAQDPDPRTRAELEQLLQNREDPGVAAELEERFSGPLEFGTAGLRGLLGAGESRMNRAVVRRATFGLSQYLLRTIPDVRDRGVVIGYDARRMSPEFSEEAALVLAAQGILTYLSVRPCPTPVAAFAMKHLNARAAVVVTASHNPPAYNGYKVYWSNGAQIVPPHDREIAAEIAEAKQANEIPLLSLDEARGKGLLRTFGDDVDALYLDAISKLSQRADGDRSLCIAYTALHGVGDRLVRAALEKARFTNVHSVTAQATPDGEFPTVEFPNPEEKGAMDLAYALGRQIGADIVLANDPDVDRLSAAVPLKSGGFLQLTGNEVGTLLGHYLLTERPNALRKPVVLASIVSSPMLGFIAKTLGVRYEETLTGFKWIANRAMEIEASERLEFTFGYEEALGYTIGTVVRDKDGISAALLLAELAAVRKAEGLTLLDELERIARRFGLFASEQHSITLSGTSGLSRINAIMDGLRATPPTSVGSLKVTSLADFRARTRRHADGSIVPVSLPTSNVLAFDLDNDARIIARPSGTEPKIKFYFDVREPIAEGEPLETARERALGKIARLKHEFLKLIKPG